MKSKLGYRLQICILKNTSLTFVEPCRRLGGESNIAPGYIYAIVDSNKDGEISESEMDSLVRLMTDENFRVFDLLGNKSFSMQAIPLPDVVLELKNKSNGKN